MSRWCWKLAAPLMLLATVCALAEKIGDKVNIKINDVQSNTYGSTNWQSGTNTYSTPTYTPPAQTPVLARQPNAFALPALYGANHVPLEL